MAIFILWNIFPQLGYSRIFSEFLGITRKSVVPKTTLLAIICQFSWPSGCTRKHPYPGIHIDIYNDWRAETILRRRTKRKKGWKSAILWLDFHDFHTVNIFFSTVEIYFVLYFSWLQRSNHKPIWSEYSLYLFRSQVLPNKIAIGLSLFAHLPVASHYVAPNALTEHSG